MSLGPVVPGSRLSEDKVVWPEDLSVGSRPDGVHGSWLQIHQDSPGHIFATGGFVIVDIDSLQLEVGVPMVSTRGVHTVLVGDDLPELGTDLVTALAGLEMDDFSHFVGEVVMWTLSSGKI